MHVYFNFEFQSAFELCELDVHVIFDERFSIPLLKNRGENLLKEVKINSQKKNYLNSQCLHSLVDYSYTEYKLPNKRRCNGFCFTVELDYVTVGSIMIFVKYVSTNLQCTHLKEQGITSIIVGKKDVSKNMLYNRHCNTEFYSVRDTYNNNYTIFYQNCGQNDNVIEMKNNIFFSDHSVPIPDTFAEIAIFKEIIKPFAGESCYVDSKKKVILIKKFIRPKSMDITVQQTKISEKYNRMIDNDMNTCLSYYTRRFTLHIELSAFTSFNGIRVTFGTNSKEHLVLLISAKYSYKISHRGVSYNCTHEIEFTTYHKGTLYII